MMLRPCPAVAAHMLQLASSNRLLQFPLHDAEQDFFDWCASIRVTAANALRASLALSLSERGCALTARYVELANLLLVPAAFLRAGSCGIKRMLVSTSLAMEHSRSLTLTGFLGQAQNHRYAVLEART